MEMAVFFDAVWARLDGSRIVVALNLLQKNWRHSGFEFNPCLTQGMMAASTAGET